jgi:outer membrane lipoprotein SlyB
MNARISHRLAAAAAVIAFGVAGPVAAQAPAPNQQPPQAQPRACSNCGTVQSIRYVEEKGQGSGVGMVAGGVLGGVLGHQIGSGTGNTVATIAGAAGGAYVGNEVEKNRKKKSYYNVVIRMDNGQTRTIQYGSQPPAREGERVKILDGNRLALITN